MGSQPFDAHQRLNLNYNDIADERLMSPPCAALPDVFMLGDTHIERPLF
jgi:hypothetical protein